MGSCASAFIVCRSKRLRAVTSALPARGLCESHPSSVAEGLEPRAALLLRAWGRQAGAVGGWQEVVTYPKAQDPGPSLFDHLEFALKNEGVALEVLAALFDAIEWTPFEAQLCLHIQARPTGQYTRRLWFLYEFLTGRRLPLEDVTQGNYVDCSTPRTITRRLPCEAGGTGWSTTSWATWISVPWCAARPSSRIRRQTARRGSRRRSWRPTTRMPCAVRSATSTRRKHAPLSTSSGRSPAWLGPRGSSPSCKILPTGRPSTRPRSSRCRT